MKIAAIFPSRPMQDFRLDLTTEQPLGIAYVAQAAIDEGYDVALHYGTPSLEKLLGVDVLAFSLLTRDVQATTRILREVKNRNSRIITVVGGSHVSGDPDFVLTDSIDYGVIGEGEQTFVELLDALRQNKEPNDVKGLVYSKDGSLVFTGERDRLDPTGLRPVRVDDFHKVDDCSLYYPAPSKRERFIPLIASRGCTRGCEFCDSESTWGKKVRHRSSEDVIAEIEELYPGDGDVFFFDDDNLFLNKKVVTEIMTNLTGKGYNLAGQGDVREIDSEMLRLLKQAGWMTILWGVESLNPKVLEREKKGSDTRKIYRVLRESERLGIFNHAMVMIGFEYETKESILEYGEKLKYLPAHQIRVSVTTPFPGTKFHQRLKQQGRSFDPDLSKWGNGHLVYGHPSIEPEEMRELQGEIVRSFYRSTQWDRRMKDMARKFPHLRQSIDEFRDYIIKNV
jgi:radical SAM superfamily enzyme YgiQ (UPF0313 family)